MLYDQDRSLTRDTVDRSAKIAIGDQVTHYRDAPIREGGENPLSIGISFNHPTKYYRKTNKKKEPSTITDSAPFSKFAKV